LAGAHPFLLGPLPVTFQAVNSSGSPIDVFTISATGAITFNTAVTLDVVLSAVLSIAEGGTGSTSAVDALVALGLTATAAEINYLDIATLGTGAASKAVVLDANGDYAFPATASITMPSGGDMTFASGSTLDVAGTLEIANVAVTATAAELNALDDAPVTVTIGLAAGAANIMRVTVTIKDGAGTAIDVPFLIEWWISEAATGIGLTADTISGDVVAVSGTEWDQVTDKKRYRYLTAATGIFSFDIEDSAKPADQYIAVVHPLTGKLIVSAASGVNWGA
jgi:hypothetical protein